MLAEGHNIHNSLLWLLMVEGALGLGLVLVVHFVYLRITLSYLRRTAWMEGRVTVMACAAFYVAMMIATFFQNFLENAIPVTIFSVVAALTMLMIYYTPAGAADPS